MAAAVWPGMSMVFRSLLWLVVLLVPGGTLLLPAMLMARRKRLAAAEVQPAAT